MSRPTPPGADEVATFLPDVLLRSGEEGARIVALHWLLQLLSARDRWRALDRNEPAPGAAGDASGTAPSDAARPEALHKARVALRRLRAVLREHRSELREVAGTRAADALKALGRATNAARDADVHRAWLDAETGGLEHAAREEGQRMRDLIDGWKAAGRAEIDAAFREYLDPHVGQLLERLSWYPRRERVGGGAVPQDAYASLVARSLESGYARIERDLLRAGGATARADDRATQERLHEIRLRLKRHRALLAPVSTAHPALAALYELETRGQDLLGAMRDADMLAQHARKAGLHDLEQVLSNQRLADAAAFLEQWQVRREDVHRQFEAALEALREMSAAPRPMRGGLPMEIERKYLLSGVPPEALAMPPLEIEQGWIPGGRLRERLRRARYPDGRVRLTRTVKLGPLEARIEIEENTREEIFQAMWPLTAGARIRKRRHVVRDGSFTWEVDVFTDRDLVLAEVELGDTATIPPMPEWLVPYLVRDVTGDPAYQNSELATADVASPAGSSDPPDSPDTHVPA